MRTTVDIDDDLLNRARALAARTRRPLGAVVDDALRMLLAVSLPTYGGSGLRPGVDLEDRSGLGVLLGDDG